MKRQVISKRWATIIVYGFLVAIFLEALSYLKPTKDLVTLWLSVFNSFSIFQQKALLFIVGIFLYLFLVKINAYSKKASLINWIYYPPITFISIFTALFLIWRSEDVTLTNILVFLYSDWSSILSALKVWLSSEQVLNAFYLIGWLLIMNTFHFFSSFKNKILSKNIVNKVAITSQSTYLEYQKWFNDDSPISNIQQLSADLKPYAERILSRIEDSKNGKQNFHISLCGSFGSGKSSIIKCVANELDSNFIYSNIDTWGTDTKSINAFVLTKVVEDVAQYTDMSAFKSLPSQYIEALKLGNNTSKLLAIFSVVSNDPQQGLIKLNDVLNTVNKKLLITIQDIDRCLEPKKATDELAALLDKLKGLSNISFIIALGYETEVSETIRKVCDHREDIIKINYRPKFLGFIQCLNKRAQDKGVITADIKGMNLKLNTHIDKHPSPYEVISSQRSFKHICRRIDLIWKEKHLLGEIDLESLCLVIILREELPLIFESLIKNKNILLSEITELKKNEQVQYTHEANQISPVRTIYLNECSQYYPSIMSFDKTRSFLTYLFECNNTLGQGALYKNSKNKYCNYLNRILLESVPSTEIKDQEVLNLFKDIGDNGVVEILISNFKDNDKKWNWIEAYNRFSNNYFKPINIEIYLTIYRQMTEHYYQETIKYIRDDERAITNADTQVFLSSLLRNCLINEKNIEEVFNITLKIPMIYDELLVRVFTENNVQLFGHLMTKLDKSNDIFEYLCIVDSSLMELHRAFNFIIEAKFESLKYPSYTEKEKNIKYGELWKSIILTLLKSSDDELNIYNFKTYLICYCIANNDFLNDSINDCIEIFEKKNIELIYSRLNDLDDKPIRIYLGDRQIFLEKERQQQLKKFSLILSNKVSN